MHLELVNGTLSLHDLVIDSKHRQSLKTQHGTCPVNLKKQEEEKKMERRRRRKKDAISLVTVCPALFS